jgi:hypothetical protein
VTARLTACTALADLIAVSTADSNALAICKVGGSVITADYIFIRL